MAQLTGTEFFFGGVNYCIGVMFPPALTRAKREMDLEVDIKAILGPGWIARQHRLWMSDGSCYPQRPSVLLRHYYSLLIPDIRTRCDAAFDAFTRATNLRAFPPHEFMQSHWLNCWTGRHETDRSRTPFFLSLSLPKIFTLVNDHITVAATEAQDCIAAGTTTTTGDFVDRIETESLMTGGSVKATTVAALRDAAGVVVRHGDDGEIVRLLKEVKGDDRIARAKLVGAFAAIALRAQLGDRLARIFDDLSLPFLDLPATTWLQEPIEIIYENTARGQRAFQRQLQFESMSILAVAAVEDQLPRTIALLDNFTSACVIAARWRARPTSDDVPPSSTSSKSASQHHHPGEPGSPETKFE